jgi:hypothetical protein
MVSSSVRSGIFLDVAPDGAELFFAVIFYKYAAPTALKKIMPDNSAKRARLGDSQTI